MYLQTNPPYNVMVPLHWLHGIKLVDCFNYAGINRSETVLVFVGAHANFNHVANFGMPVFTVFNGDLDGLYRGQILRIFGECSL